MNATKFAGVVAIASGVALLVAVIASAIAGPGPGFGSGAGWSVPGGMGPGHMGNVPMGPGMMGSGGMAPGMMGPGHMGGYGPGSPAADTTIPGAPAVTVTANELSFSPTEVSLPANAPANLTLVNRSALPHDLTVPALGVRVVAGPGETRTVGLRALPAGRYAAYCSVPGHADAGMRMLVVVQ